VHAAVERLDSAHRRRHVRGLRVVHVQHAVHGAHLLQPVRHAGERAQRAGHRLRRHARLDRGRRRAAGVLEVVLAAEADLPRRKRQRPELDAPPLPRDLEARRHDRHLVRRLVAEQPQLRVPVCLERAVPVEVVLGDVEEQRGVGRQRLGVLGLEARHLADDGGLGVDRAHQRGQRRAHVAGQRDGQARLPPDRAEQLGGGGLAVRAGHRHEAVRQQPPGQLQLAEHRHAALPRCRDHGRLVRHARALDHELGAVEQVQSVDAQVGVDVVRHLRRAGVHGDHLSVLAEHAGGRRAGPRQPDHEVRPVGKRRPHEPGIEDW
jgi:hypothetical protein